MSIERAHLRRVLEHLLQGPDFDRMAEEFGLPLDEVHREVGGLATPLRRILEALRRRRGPQALWPERFHLVERALVPYRVACLAVDPRSGFVAAHALGGGPFAGFEFACLVGNAWPGVALYEAPRGMAFAPLWDAYADLAPSHGGVPQPPADHALARLLSVQVILRQLAGDAPDGSTSPAAFFGLTERRWGLDELTDEVHASAERPLEGP